MPRRWPRASAGSGNGLPVRPCTGVNLHQALCFSAVRADLRRAGRRAPRPQRVHRAAVPAARLRHPLGRADPQRAQAVPRPVQEPVLRARRGRVLPGPRAAARWSAGSPRTWTAAGTSSRAATTAGSASSRPKTTPRSRRRCFETAADWVRGHGRDRLLGPADFTTNDEVGLLVEGYERAPMVLQPWHPPYYRELLEGQGLAKAMDLLMWELWLGDLKQGDAFHDFIEEAARKCEEEHGVTSATCARTTSRPRSGASWRSTTRPGARTGASSRSPTPRSSSRPRT